MAIKTKKMKRPPYTPAAVGRLMGESGCAVRNLIAKGLLKAVNWGGPLRANYRIEADEVEFYQIHGRAGLHARAAGK